MYTVIYSREQTSHNGILHIECVETEKEALDFIRLKTIEQEHLESEEYRIYKSRDTYGDYAFIVICNGKVLYENNFDSIFDKCIYPCTNYSEYEKFNDAYREGREQSKVLTQIISKLESEEKAYNSAMSSYNANLKKQQQEEEEERALLKSLLEKYPDINT